MTLHKGQRLGPYEIETPAGAGGMGEVYKAKDTRLDRTVAIKVLPERTAKNADLRARFEREAKAISSLNHPNICTLHDIGHQNEIDFLVMEYLEGETLAERLKKGALEFPDALETGIQIAEGLHAAHRQGLIHRDLKPSNVFLTREGAKLLDFGLAKLRTEGELVEGADGDTRTTPITGTGTIVGTMQYMSPEQLEGQEADTRSDIFAFGATLYEMVARKRAFEGKSHASLIAAVMSSNPIPVSQVKPTTPPALDRLIRKCLKKDPEQRWQSMRDLADELRWIMDAGSQAGIPTPVSVRRRRHFRLVWAVAVAAMLAVITLAIILMLQEQPMPITSRLTYVPEIAMGDVEWPRISPDGRLLAFLATDSLGEKMIWIRPLNSFEAYSLAGTEDAQRPFWSPNSRYLAFFSGEQLKKIPAAGGPAQLICEARGADGSWGSAGVILFDFTAGDPLFKVSAKGGVPSAATTINDERGEQTHSWPWFLPDGNHFLYLVSVYRDSGTTGRASSDYEVLKVGSLDGSVEKELVRVDSRVEYTSSGYIVYCREGVLFARKFDIGKLDFTGEPIPIAEDIALGTDTYQFSISQGGVMVYTAGRTGFESQIVATDRHGQDLDTVGQPARYRDLALSPDENRLAYDKAGPQTGFRDVWVYDLVRGVNTRITMHRGHDWNPVWSPDGEQIAYASNRLGSPGIMSRLANGTGEPKLICYRSETGTRPSDWSRDGGAISAYQFENGWDIIVIDPDDSTNILRSLITSHNEMNGHISPDGRYLAYQSDESGRYEIYILDLNELSNKWQVSANGGHSPRWRGDGEELYYWDPNYSMMAVAVNVDGEHIEIGIPQQLFTRTINKSSVWPRAWYDVSNSGDRFYLNVPIGRARSEFVVVQNWDAELREKD